MTDFLAWPATREARDTLVAWLREQAEIEAVGSRDFGRGFMQAVEVLDRAPVRCHSCAYPPGVAGAVVSCTDCGLQWRLSRHGATAARA